jgi:predicted O-methyltransferase YrrM
MPAPVRNLIRRLVGAPAPQPWAFGRPPAPGRPTWEEDGIQPPPVPANKYTLPRSGLEFFPTRTIEQFAGDPGTGRTWPFPPYLDNPAVPWLRTLKDLYSRPQSFPASLSPEAGLLLHALVLNIRPRLIVEVGMFLGVSTLWMGAALEQSGSGLLHGFDDFTPVLPAAWRPQGLEIDRELFVRGVVESAALTHRVTLHKGRSTPTLFTAHDELRAAGEGGVQLAFIDGDHTAFSGTHDLLAIEPLLQTGGYLILHDTFPELCSYDGPRFVLDHINRLGAGLYESCEIYLAPVNYGLAVLRRVG